MVPSFIQTEDNIIWFAFLKKDNSYICFPKKIDGYKGREYSEWYSDSLDRKLINYKRKLEFFDEYVYVVDIDKVIKFYNPIEFLLTKRHLQLKYNFDVYVLNIVDAISRFFNINPENIGVEGSILLDCYTENSDIDLLVFGEENGLKIQNGFKAFKNYDNISVFSDEQVNAYIEKRKNCGYGNNQKQMKKQFLRRYYGYILDKQFSIICVCNENESDYIDLNRRIKFNDVFEGILTIIDDHYSCFVPCKYIAIDSMGKKYIIEIFNHYGINQVKKGEKVFVRGKMYNNVINNENIIILSFWSNIRERFDLCE